MNCAKCGTEVAPARLSCPVCRALLHADELKRLASKAEAAAGNGDLTAELSAWRSALELLPPDSGQFEQVARKIDDLSRRVDASPRAAGPSLGGVWKRGGALAAVGLLAWKLKSLLLILLTKGKLLFLGLTKAGTVFSMALSLGVYWTAFGWALALGLILSLYVHEMGHVAVLQRFGVRASFPMFIPGLGAVVLLKQRLANPSEDARVGLAGPLWGLGAAVTCYLAFLGTGWPILVAVARVGAWLNLFNLLPIWQLDGGRAFRALSRFQRIVAAAAMATLWIWTREGLLVLLFLVAAARCFTPDAPTSGDRTAFIQYLVLLGSLSAFCLLHVPLTS